MQITVHTKASCQPCKATRRKLDQLEIDYIPQELNEESAKRFSALGLGSAPIVEVDLGFGAVWRWSGHAPTQLEKLDHAFSCADPVCNTCEAVIAA